MRDLYLGGVVDFDRMFGEWVERHEAAGRFESTALLFTSDHGEAFGEHRDLYHGASVWESQIRVPMFLFGGGLDARPVTHAASLVDLPQTFADLAGIEPSRYWGGTSLLALDAERAVFAFETGA